ncbi:MAG: CoA transferase [Chloroflexi bacterium]|nr:CoA transferase [Chloroflexota bacterium]
MLPLAGIRVIDATVIFSGPYCGKQLADFGAEVIKLESAKHPDPSRGSPNPPRGSGVYPDGEPGPRPWNRAGLFNALNTSKLSLSVDLTTPAGVGIVKRLAKVSDVVMDNFRANVMARFGLGYEALREVNPSIIVISMSANGMSGPERDYAAFGATLEQTTGMAWLTGYGPDDAPYRGGVNYPDPVAGLHAVGAILAALRHRRRTGKGQFVDLSQREGAACLVGESILDYTINGRIAERRGNRDSSMAPHGCYRCKGEDSWVTIAIGTDEQWKSFSVAIGSPAWATEARFRTVLGRWQNQNELDKLVEGWTVGRDHVEIMHLLQKVGVPAAPVLNNVELLHDPHLNRRGFWEWVNHPDAGRHLHYGASVRLAATPGGIQRHAPCLGEHNHYVLRAILGLSEDEVRQLDDAGVTNSDPRSLQPG